jgi:hypothetical protein
MLQVFNIDVVKVDRDMLQASVSNVSFVFFRRMLQVFLLRCCKCFTYMLQVFLSRCCICFAMVFQVFSGFLRVF